MSLSLFRRKPRIFQIGFNRCATRSIWRFLEDNGIPAVHWEHGRIAQCFYARKERGENPFTDYTASLVRPFRGKIAFTDMIHFDGTTLLEPYRDFEYIFRFYPDAYFILNTRNIEGWIKSRTAHSRGTFMSMYQTYLGGVSAPEVQAVWREDWHRHHAKVEAFFNDKPGQFLRFNVEADAPAVLADFLRPSFGKLNPDFFGWVR